MPNKEKETQSGRGASSNAASNKAILAAITKQDTELAKVSKLVDGLKKSMEERFDPIESCLSTLQKKHHEVERRMGDMDEALSTADQCITVNELNYRWLTAASVLSSMIWRDALVGLTYGLSVSKREKRRVDPPNSSPS